MLVWRVYTNLLKLHPWKTQMISTGLLMGAGDALAQTCVERRSILKNEFNFNRNLRFFCLGCFFVAPQIRVWYNFLERRVYISRFPKATPLARMALDQTVFAPISMTAFLIVLRILEGNSLQTAINRWKSDVLDIYLTSLKVWPAVQLVNFYFVPLEHRLLLVQSVALLWNTYLAWRTSRGV